MAGFEVITHGRFWVIAEDQHNSKLVAIWTAAHQQKQPDFALPISLQSNQQVTSSKSKLFR